ncbi:MAG: hypothetical protein P1P74_06030 [Desulfuromonadales bacterium]|nr:hypothetical protein [Desulfuromonadales bacterium]
MPLNQSEIGTLLADGLLPNLGAAPEDDGAAAATPAAVKSTATPTGPLNHLQVIK